MVRSTSPTPLYHRIYAVMRERIVKDYYRSDVAIPSEAELAESFSVSRITIRKAMEMLTTEGLVTRTRGKGTFINVRTKANNLNRAVGQHDAYPFVLTPEVIEKLGFIAKIIRAAGTVQWTVPGPKGPIPINTPAAA